MPGTQSYAQLSPWLIAVMMVGMIFRLRNFPRPLPPHHEHLPPLKTFLAIPLSGLHPVSFLFTIRQNARLETSPTQTSQPGRSAIPSTRHPRRWLFVRSLDDLPAFYDQANEGRDEQPHVEPWDVEE